jgi:phosphoglucomutase
MTTPNIAVASHITPTPTITHCVTKSTPQATLQYDGIIADEQHNAPAVSAVITQRETTPETENVSASMVREYHRRLKKNYCASLVHSQMH